MKPNFTVSCLRRSNSLKFSLRGNLPKVDCKVSSLKVNNSISRLIFTNKLIIDMQGNLSTGCGLLLKAHLFQYLGKTCCMFLETVLRRTKRNKRLLAVIQVSPAFPFPEKKKLCLKQACDKHNETIISCLGQLG